MLASLHKKQKPKDILSAQLTSIPTGYVNIVNHLSTPGLKNFSNQSSNADSQSTLNYPSFNFVCRKFLPKTSSIARTTEC